ncbi:hypothetical protein M422DRAFT_138839, partial [Sphaerobolus stellatus SS14]
LLLSVVLRDGLFIAHSKESFFAAFPSKTQDLSVLEELVEIDKLDFLVAFSSASTFGNPGQTNYASANTLLEGRLSRYRNAFSLIVPAVLDSSVMVLEDGFTPQPRFKPWLPWALSSTRLCDILEDALRKSSHTKFSSYVPDFQWSHVLKQFGPS